MLWHPRTRRPYGPHTCPLSPLRTSTVHSVLQGSGVDVFTCHPGLVSTPLYDRTSPGAGPCASFQTQGFPRAAAAGRC